MGCGVERFEREHEAGLRGCDESFEDIGEVGG